MVNHNNLPTRPMPLFIKKVQDRFWSNVNIGENKEVCWEWKDTLTKKGYGVFNSNCKTYGSHRVSYFLHYGIDPLNKMIRHKCNNSKCVNPNHLLMGTLQDNYEDARKKYRLEGNEHWNTKLNESQVLEIIKEYADATDITYRMLAEKYNVNTITILDIIHKKTWKHLSVDMPQYRSNLRFGTKNGMTKLTDSDVLDILKIYSKGGITYQQLATKYNVAMTNICSIILRKTWKHITI